MIEEQRQQIGTLKALGYSDGVIAFKYFAYAMLSTVSGALAGVVVGEKILPWVIMNAYGMLYTGLPYYMTPLNWEQGGLAILASAACTGVATIAACYKELAARSGRADAAGSTEKRQTDFPGTHRRTLETSELYAEINRAESGAV